MTAVTIEPGIPVLRSFSEAKAKEFYVEFLGMTIAWEHRFADGMPLYMCVERSGLTLHLTEHHGDATPGSTVFVRMRGIDAYRAELLAKGAAFCRPGIVDQPWGREMTVADPFGNRIRFCEQAD